MRAATSKLTVVQLLPELHGGGVERGTLEIAKGLVAAGHRSIVISAGGRMVAELERDGSEHITLPVHRKRLGSLMQIMPLRRLLQSLQPDILHARSRVPAWLGYLAWKTLPPDRRPHFVTTVHGLYSVNAYSAIMTRGEAVIAVSQTIERYIAENYPQVAAANVRRIYRGIDPAAFPYGFQASSEWLTRWHEQMPQLIGKPLLCLPGRITRLKGHLEFVDLIAALHQRGVPAQAIIVGGDDPNRQGYLREIRARIAESGLTEAVHFLGHRSDMRELYSVSDLVFSLSTKPESFGRTVLETLALGRPVIGYDHGGVGEILAELFPAGRVPLRNHDELLARTLLLLQQPSKPKPNERFLLANMIGQTLALYQELVNRSPT